MSEQKKPFEIKRLHPRPTEIPSTEAPADYLLDNIDDLFSEVHAMEYKQLSAIHDALVEKRDSFDRSLGERRKSNEVMRDEKGRKVEWTHKDRDLFRVVEQKMREKAPKADNIFQGRSLREMQQARAALIIKQEQNHGLPPNEIELLHKMNKRIEEMGGGV